MRDVEAVGERTAKETQETCPGVEKRPDHDDGQAEGVLHVFLDEGVDLICGATGGLGETVEGFPVGVLDVEVEV